MLHEMIQSEKTRTEQSLEKEVDSQIQSMSRDIIGNLMAVRLPQRQESLSDFHREIREFLLTYLGAL